MSQDLVGCFAQLDLSDAQPPTLAAEMLMPGSVLTDNPATTSHIPRSVNASVSSSATLMSTSIQYVSMPTGAVSATSPTMIAMPEGDIFSHGAVSPPPLANMQQIRYIQQAGQNGAGSFIKFAELPPGAIVYMAAPPQSQTSESIGPLSRAPEQTGGWISQFPLAQSAAPLTSSTASGIMINSTSLQGIHSPMLQIQPTALPPPPPQLLGVNSGGVHVNFEENFNVLSEDKKTMLSIPRDVIEPTVGSSKYALQGSSACYTFRFQLCRGYQQGRCVHRHQCAFIHSRHISNPLLAGHVTYTQVHRNVPVVSLAQALYPRHPEGMLLQVYDAVQSKNVQVESSHMYVTHGSLAGYRAALMDHAGGEGSVTGSLSGILNPDTGLLSSSVRLQFCLHFDKSLCARGETCNFVHRVDVVPGLAPPAEQPPLSSVLMEQLRPMQTPTPSISTSHLPNYPHMTPTPQYTLQSTSHLSTSTASGHFLTNTHYFPIHSSVPATQPTFLGAGVPDQQFIRFANVADSRLAQSWPAPSVQPAASAVGYGMPLFLQPTAAPSMPSALLQPNTNYF
jgi:hypothetical protein